MEFDKNKFFYRVYGLNVKSDFEIDELIVLDENQRKKIDVEIVNSKVTGKIKEYILNENTAKYSREHMWFQGNKVSYFEILKGNKIIAETLPNYDRDMFKIYLLGIVFSLLMIQRNKVSIHGGAVDIKGKGILIVGDSGAGKSTLITAFKKKGYKLLADDMSAIDNSSNGEILINPSFPMQRITYDVVEKFGYDKSKFNRIFLNREKYFIPAYDEFQFEDRNLSAIFHLSQDNCDSVLINEVKGSEKINIVLNSIFRGYVINDIGMDKAYFIKCLDIAKKTPIYRIIRPRDMITTDKQIDLIIEKLSN